MSTTTSTTLKTAGTSALALLAAFLIQKATDKETKFADTKTALTTLALQTVQQVITDKLAATTDTNTTTAAQ